MKLTSSLKSEIRWFISGLIAVLLASFLIGWPASGVIIYLIGYVIWLLSRLNDIVHWLDKRAKVSDAPPTVGLTNEIVQLVHREKKYSRKQKNRYRSTLAQFNSLAAYLPDATVVLSRENEIRWSNSAALSLLNIHPERDKGQRIDNLIRLPEFREFLLSDGGIEELEIPAPLAPETVLAVRKVRTGKHMTVLIAADITQRVHVREMRKAFVADVSHELRTPLTVIRGYVEMLSEDKSLDASVHKSLEHISSQSDRMRGIVEDLLQLSKLEANRLGENEGHAVDISSMIVTMISALSDMSTNHTIELDVDTDRGVIGSERELHSACNNLLTNAIRYTDPGTLIKVSWRINDDGGMSYTVVDNGPGIEARHISRLSERFYRVDASRSRDEGGTGLGLAIVKHAAQRHGGTLHIISTPGTGSEFEIAFPPSRTTPLRLTGNP